MAQLLTYSEFKALVDVNDSTLSDKFNRIESTKEETYLYALIGEDLVVKLKSGSYTTLMDLTKKCLAWEIYRHLTELGSVIITGNGAINRDSDYSNRVEFADKRAKLDSVVTVLRQYESRLIELIQAGTYTEWNSNVKTSVNEVLKITSIGD